MKRVILVLLTLLLSIGILCNSSGISASSAKKQDLEIEIISPPVICNAVSFPLVAVVTNTRSGKVQLKKAKWKLSGKEYIDELNDEVYAAGDAKNIVKSLRNKKNLLTEEEMTMLKNQSEKMKNGTRFIRFTVTQQMAEEIKNKGSISVNIALEGTDVSEQKELNANSMITLKSGRAPQRPPVAPGAHHSDWYFGDTHSHSTYTWDYYFGDGIYTIPELKSLAMAAGLDWLVLTDHAYCLDNSKFNTEKNAVTSLCDSAFAFLYGEELSCAELVNGNKAYDTCHYNGILNSTFVPCSTDIFRKASSPDSQQGINYLKQYGGLATINHPNWGTGSFESWNFNINTYPYTHGETGMEILNGGWSDTNDGSATRWVDHRLLKGEKVFPFAGSDTESANHFGECYTVAYADYLTQTNIKDNLSSGHQYVTTYPGLAMWARKSGTSTWSWMGDTLTMGSGTSEVYISYTDSTSGLNIYVMKGKSGWSSEQQVYSTTTAAGSGVFTTNISVEPGCYLRVYCVEANDQNYRAYGSPIWFN